MSASSVEVGHIGKGSHDTLDMGACAMEWVDVLDMARRGEDVGPDVEVSDRPECSCPVIAALVRSWNDSLGDDDRQRIMAPLIPHLLDTRSTSEAEERRAWMAVDWSIRTMLPAWLDLAGLTDHATTLTVLLEVVDGASLRLGAAGAAVRAAAGAAGAAVRAAAEDAGAAGAAVRAAAEDAAWAAAGATLRPTVLALQASAVDLIHRMIAVGGDA